MLYAKALTKTPELDAIIPTERTTRVRSHRYALQTDDDNTRIALYRRIDRSVQHTDKGYTVCGKDSANLPDRLIRT